jgi:hypothetical protein
MKKCSTSLMIKEIQIKATLRFHLIPVRAVIIDNTKNNKCWHGWWGQRGSLSTVGGNVTSCNH